MIENRQVMIALDRDGTEWNVIVTYKASGSSTLWLLHSKAEALDEAERQARKHGLPVTDDFAARMAEDVRVRGPRHATTQAAARTDIPLPRWVAVSDEDASGNDPRPPGPGPDDPGGHGQA